MEGKATSITPISGIDAQSALALAESRDVINEIWTDFCGLMRTKTPTGESFARISKPKITYEFAKDITSAVFLEVNRITARTDFTEDQINAYLRKQCQVMSDWFATEGINNLVSPKVWEKCIELSKPDPKAEAIKIDGKEIRPSLWLSKYGIPWTYDTPFNIDMLNIIIKEYGIENESFGQDIILRHIFWCVRFFVHAGINRSLNHLTLDHEKVVHKESFVSGITGDAKKSEGALEFLKKKFQSGFAAK